MLKHKNFSRLLLILSLFLFFSCGKPSKDYNVTLDDKALYVKIDKTEYKDGEDLVISEVTYNGIHLDWIKNDYEKNGYFITTNNQYPLSAIVVNLTMGTNVEKNDLLFYIGYFNASEGEHGTVHLSEQRKVTITNDNALKPWVWYVVTGVVIFGVIGMTLFTRHYKMKKEEK